LTLIFLPRGFCTPVFDLSLRVASSNMDYFMRNLLLDIFMPLSPSYSRNHPRHPFYYHTPLSKLTIHLLECYSHYSLRMVLSRSHLALLYACNFLSRSNHFSLPNVSTIQSCFVQGTQNTVIHYCEVIRIQIARRYPRYTTNRFDFSVCTWPSKVRFIQYTSICDQHHLAPKVNSDRQSNGPYKVLNRRASGLAG
jgi:hypothetical protein